MLSSTTQTPTDLLVEGRGALARGAWEEARSRFSRACEIDASVDALVGLGVAARYQLDAEAALQAHEHAYRLARAAGDDDTAAWVAVQLCYDSYAFRGLAEAMGWVERAALLVAGRPPTIASAFVPFMRAYVALLGRNDPETGRAGSVEARDCARAVGAVDLEMLALALEGLSLVSLGRVEDGMTKLDAAAAAALAGEMTDADSIETVCCFMIDACKRVRDLERANEWCLRVREVAVRFDDRQMFAICRIHHADVLLWHGAWAAAEAELASSARELERIRPGREVDAVVRLAELRRRQGRLVDAEELLARSEPHRFHALVEGLLALDRGDGREACDAAARFLRRIGGADRFERVAGLELLLRASLAAGDDETAREAADEISAIAAGASTAPLRAAALVAEGRIAAAQGESEIARVLLEDGVDLFDAAGARYDAALARQELASALRATGDESGARAAELEAHAALQALGASVEALPAGPLSPRETEVLRLIARGLSNDEIARTLVLSTRTVERHVANIYTKIGAHGRTGRAMATAWAHRHGNG